MGTLLEFVTLPLQKHVFYEINTGALTVDIKGLGNAYIGLARKPSNKCDFWITIGDGDNSYISSEESRQVKLTLPNTLSRDVYKTFIITWYNGRVRLQLQSVSPPVSISLPSDIPNIKFVTFAVLRSAQAYPVHWRIELPPQRPTRSLKPIEGGAPRWVSSTQIDQIPDDAIIGGFDGEPLYIIRASHRGSVTPGKFVPSEGAAFIPWGGQAHEKNEFEVLCGYDIAWEAARGDAVPSSALAAGRSEQGEPLHVGRARPPGHSRYPLVPGKVQPSHRCCYIAHGEREIANTSYEVLVTPFKNNYAAHRTMVPEFKNLPRYNEFRTAEEDFDNQEDSDD